jgi:uridylate kinase
VLAPDLDPGRVERYADAVTSLVDAGHEVGVVVGGGGVAREYIETARALGANEVELDRVGIDVTRINARLLVAALGDLAAPRPAHDYGTAAEAFRRGDVAVMGGVAPGQTTDAVAAALAEDAGADLLVFATSADGVYTADPNVEADAEKLRTLSAGELVDVVAPMSRDAGASAPVDLLAAKLIQRAGLRALVLDGSDPEAVETAVLRGEHTGTDVTPDGAENPAAWDG